MSVYAKEKKIVHHYFSQLEKADWGVDETLERFGCYRSDFQTNFRSTTLLGCIRCGRERKDILQECIAGLALMMFILKISMRFLRGFFRVAIENGINHHWLIHIS